MYSRYVYVCQAAKDGSFSISDIFAFLAIVISIAVPVITNKITKRNSVKETFWMREILIPQFTDILFKFVKESPSKIIDGKNKFYAEYALDVINSLRDSALVLGVASKDLKNSIEREIDEFENKMMNVSESEYTDLLCEFSRKLVKAIQDAQFGA